MQEWVPVLGGEYDGRVGQLRHERKKSAKTPCKTHRSHGSPGLVDRSAATFRCSLGLRSLLQTPIFCCSIEVWIKVTPSHLLEVIACCALLPLAQTVTSCSDPLQADQLRRRQSFVENFEAVVAAMADARLAEEEQEVRRLKAQSPQFRQVCQRSCGLSPISACHENCGSHFCVRHGSVAHLLSCSCRYDCHERFKDYLQSLEGGLWWLRMREGVRAL